ncbi:hypothetical protein OH77DRAFT_1201729 [Trametes cingulata]|nr:hypothetical protein OH77DRAFT_1201729 [Trametes cingulata]
MESASPRRRRRRSRERSSSSAQLLLSREFRVEFVRLCGRGPGARTREPDGTYAGMMRVEVKQPGYGHPAMDGADAHRLRVASACTKGRRLYAFSHSLSATTTSSECSSPYPYQPIRTAAGVSCLAESLNRVHGTRSEHDSSRAPSPSLARLRHTHGTAYGRRPWTR